MSTAAAFAAAVRTAVQDQPYTVVDEIPDGFTVQIDVADARWWGLLQQRGLRSTFRWVVRMGGPGTYSVTDTSTRLDWAAGADGQLRPSLSARASTFQGTQISLRRESIWGLREDGTFGPVVDYVFDSSEGRALIDAVAERQGLKKTMNSAAKVGLIVAIGAVGLIVLGGVIALVLALTGNLG